ncbi:DegT/DnrJ/EryC1/StrS aminotransferase family protein [Candidatus Nitrosopelagicus sp.]|nr:DegT/DnrJ/EryC1/StrS aminotransferase family protein [Candidatus Nitrosopelagicus sp.]MDC0240889.1 DegT/DnrJ/EryC1/StrS aminotransferase family protein [Candidatus Nitrosopelagicus sp.]
MKSTKQSFKNTKSKKIKPKRSKKIKLFDPVIGLDEEKEIIKILKSGNWASGAGNGKVFEFENKFCDYVGSKQCVAVNSGTAALNLSLSLLDLKNKEVILPSLSFVSTAHAVTLNGGIPKFVDIDPKTLCIDPKKIKSSISKKTIAILPVHFAGIACNLDHISKICKENNLYLIEDAAHAAGTKYKSNRIGKHGMAICFSFHPVKNLAMPTGGLIAINGDKNKKLKKILNERRWCGITDRIGTNYDVKNVGWNYYMNELSAGIGLIQLKKLDKNNKLRRKIALRYFNEINLEQKMPFDNNASYHFYWILSKNREKLMNKLAEHGIETGTHYKPIHQMSMYKTKQKLPITESAGKKIVTLPTHPNLKNFQIKKIINCINEFT